MKVTVSGLVLCNLDEIESAYDGELSEEGMLTRASVLKELHTRLSEIDGLEFLTERIKSRTFATNRLSEFATADALVSFADVLTWYASVCAGLKRAGPVIHLSSVM